MRAAFWAVVLLMMSAGCRSVATTVVERVISDTVVVVRERCDTLRLSDSVVVREWMRGDTVVVERSHRSSRDRMRMVSDTIREVRVDSIPVAVARETASSGKREFDGRVVAAVALTIVLIIVMIRNK